jgi:hypothetical protein
VRNKFSEIILLLQFKKITETLVALQSCRHATLSVGPFLIHRVVAGSKDGIFRKDRICKLSVKIFFIFK